ncbi:hypothetical protein B7988_00040 [Fibrobacter sp. UWB1]|nr:hypothetical protein B7988_00040 [Fibrobacter sp. UWB1]
MTEANWRFISHEFQDWCDGNGIKILYTQPGCPTQNSYIERFNGSYRRSVDENWVILYTLNLS